MKFSVERMIFVMTIFSGILLLSGCSSLPHTGCNSIIPPLRTYEDVVKVDGPHLLEVSDSIEEFNRGTYRFNYYFDEYLFLPVVRTYEFILPDYVEDRVSNAIDNINEFGNFTNNILQLKIKASGITLSRFVVNSTVGVAGFWDPATTWGLKRQSEDFGKTLGYYGVGNGSYIVLPIMGPSNVRDTTGLMGDTAAFSLAGPVAWINNTGITTSFSGTSAVDKRHRIPFHYRQSGSPFEYELLRMLYTLKRDYDISN